MIFQLLEDLTEMSTMRNCKDIFGYIESKQDILGKVHAFRLFQVFCLYFYPCS
jgi:THO complex subunit 1